MKKKKLLRGLEEMAERVRRAEERAGRAIDAHHEKLREAQRMSRVVEAARWLAERVTPETMQALRDSLHDLDRVRDDE